MLKKNYLSVRLGCIAAALLCLALGATAQSNIYRDNNSTSALPLVMGEKDSKFRFIPSATNIALKEVETIFNQSGDDADWFYFDYDITKVFTAHDYLDVFITKEPGENDRTGYIEVTTSNNGKTYIYLMQPKKRCVYAKQTNLDTSFFVAFLPNHRQSTINLFLYATTNSKKSSVSIYRNDNNAAIASNIQLEQNKVKAVYSANGSHSSLYSNVPAYGDTHQSTTTIKSLHVKSDSAIALYAYNAASSTSEISCITPTSALSDEYFIMSYRSTYATNPMSTPGEMSKSDYPEVFLVIATEDNTLVTINPSVDLSGANNYANGKANVPFTVKLARGGTYLVRAKTSYTGTGQYNSHPELAGTHIKASQRVAVFSGIECGNIDPTCGACDHVYEQMLPLRAWGKRYAVVNTSKGRNVYRIGAAYDNTTVTITKSSGAKETLTINRGKYAEREIVTSTSPFAYVEADKPVQIGLFGMSASCLDSYGGGDSDPFLAMVGPADRGLFTATFTPIKTLAGITGYPNGRHYMTVVVDKRYQDSTTLWQTTGGLKGPVSLTFNDMPNTPYAYSTKELTYSENYNYTLSNPYGFTAYSYGIGYYEGYGYLIGAQLGEKLGEADLGGVIKENYTFCLNQPSNLPACLDGSTSCGPLDKYYWYETLTDWNNDKEMGGPPNINTSSVGTHTYFASLESGCGILYPRQITIEVLPLPKVTLPVSKPTDTILVCLDADANFDYGGRPLGGTYTFAAGEPNEGKTFTHKGAGAGVHKVTYTYKNANDCESSATAFFNVETLDRSPKLNIVGGHASFCRGSTLRLEVLNAPNRTYQWHYADLPIPNETNRTYNIAPGAQTYKGGKYSVYIANANGCTVTIDTIVTMHEAPPQPQVSTYNSTTACAGISYELYDAAGVLDISSQNYQWYRTSIDPFNAIGDSTYLLKVENDNVPGIRRYILGAVNLISGRPREEGCWSYGELNLTVHEAASQALITTPGDVKEICMGDSLKLTAVAGNSSTYKWYFIDGTGARAELPSTGARDYYAKMAGKYQVLSVSAEGCRAKDESDTVRVTRHSIPVTPVITVGQRVCEGDSIKVDASSPGATLFEWYAVSSDNVYYTPINGVSKGNYYVKESGRYAVIAKQQHSQVTCSSPYSPPEAVSLLPTPLPPVITGNTDICAGSNNVKLVATPPSGSAAVDKYVWYRNGTQLTNVSGDTCRVSQAVGSASYTVVAHNGICHSAHSTVTTVTAWKPTAAITPPSKTDVCFGTTVTLDASTDAGMGRSFQWYDGNTPIPGSDKPVYVVSSADPSITKTGSYSFVVADVRGCKSDASNVVKVNIYKPPTDPTIAITPGGDICAGSTMTLTASPSGEAKYTWYYKGTQVSDGASNTYTILSVSDINAGEYTVKTTSSDGCESKEGVTTAAVYPLPTAPSILANVTSICVGDSAWLEDQSGFLYKGYKWYYTDAEQQKHLLPLSDHGIFVKEPGVYSVVGISSHGCASPESNKVTITSYPNPNMPNLSSLKGDGCTNTINTIDASSLGATSWQWYSVPLGGGNPSEINGATSATYTVGGSGRYAARAYKLYMGVGLALTCPSPLSAPREVTLVEAPLAPVISGNTDVCAGSNNVQLVAKPATGSAAVNKYVWYKDGTQLSAMFGAAGDTCRISQLTAGTANYRAMAYNGVCKSPQSDPTAVAAWKPTVSISAEGRPTEVCFGATVTLKATPIEVGRTYQWYENGNPIPGNNVPSYVVSSSNPLATKTGIYHLVVTDKWGCSSVASNAISATIFQLPTDPTITIAPSGDICAGSNITLTATPPGEAGYTWFFEGAPKGSGVSNTYAISSVTTSDAGRYTVETTNSDNCRSKEGAATVVVYPQPPQLIINPSATSICNGDSAWLDAYTNIVGYTYKEYRWYIEAGGYKQQLPLLSGNRISVKAPGKYSVVGISDHGCASPESAAVELTSHANPNTPNLSPLTGDGCTNTTNTITASSSGATSWRWYSVPSGGSPILINGATTSTYTVTESGHYAARAYKLYADGLTCSSPLSAPREATLVEAPLLPVITGSTDVCAGSNNVELVAKPAPGSATVTKYVWYRDGTQMSVMSGNANDTCRTSQGTAGTAYYTAVAYNGVCLSPSSAVTTVTAWKPTASIIPPSSTNVCFGTSVTLTANTNADKGRSFQWYDGSTPIPGNDVPSYVVSSSNPSNKKTGSYSFVVTDVWGCSSEVSNAVPVTIFRQPDNPTVTITPSGDICAGSSLTLTATPPGEASYTWFFKKDGKPVVRLSWANNTYTIASVSADSAGQYSVITTNSDGCTSNDGVTTAVVYPLPPKPRIQPKDDKVSICDGDSTEFEVFADIGGYTYKEFKWYIVADGQKQLLPLSSHRISVKKAGLYSVMCVSDHGCISPESDAVTITSHANPNKPGLSPLIGDGCTNTTNTVTATSTGATSWQWYSIPSGGKPDAITGATSGTYTVKESGHYAAQAYKLYANGLTCSSPLSDSREISLVEAPLAPVINGNANVCVGNNNVTLIAKAAPNSAKITSYRWYKNSTQMTSITIDTCRDSHSTGYGPQVYKYETEALNGVCISAKTTKEVTVWKPKVEIAAKGGVKDTCYGHTVTLSATAVTGGTYRWYESGKLISGADAPAYMVSSNNPSANKSNSYYVYVTDGYGCESEQSNELTVNIYKPPVDPVITPSYKAGVCAGSSITLTASPAGEGIYEWFLEKNGTYTPVANTSTNNVYTIPNAQLSHEGRYAVRITSGAGCVSKEGWDTVVVYPTPSKPIVETAAVHICSGDSVRIWAYDAGGYVYKQHEWYLQDGNGRRQLPALSGKNIFGKDPGSYSVIGISEHGCRSAESSAIKIETHGKPDQPTISPSDDSVTVCTNGATTLTAYSPNATSYQWYAVYPNDTATLPGATGSSYSVTGSGGIYAARAYLLWGKGDYNLMCPSVLRSKPKITLLYPVPAPRVLEGKFTACAGDTITLRAKDLADPPVPIAQYRWYKNGNLVHSTTTDSCLVTEIADATYTVVAESHMKCASDPSPSQRVSIRKPSIYIAGNDTAVCFGNIVTLQTVTTTNPAKSKYEWYKNDVLIDGAISSFLQVRSDAIPTVGENASYYAYVIDEQGCRSADPSPTISVSMLALPPTPVFVPPPPVCEGSGLTLRVSPSGAGTYTWFVERNGVSDSLAITSDTIYQISGAQASNAGQYRVKITNRWSCRSESVGQVMVYPLPQNPMISPHETRQICTDDSVLLTANTIGSIAGYHHTWYFNDGIREVEYLQGDRLYAKQAGTYSVASVSDQGCMSNGKDAVEVKVLRRPAPPVIFPEDPVISVCANDATTIRGSSSGATSYQWYAVDISGTLNPIGNATKSDYVVGESGRYTVRAYIKHSDELSCSALSAQQRVMEIFMVPPPPVLAASKPSGCAGDTITLTASPGPGSPAIAAYTWYKNDAEMAFPTINTHFTTSIGTAAYKVSTVSNQGCRSDASAFKEISIHARPTVSIDGGDRESCGGRLTLSSSTNAVAGSYEWYENGIAVPEASTSYYVVQAVDPIKGQKASYYLYVTDRYGCRSENPSNTVGVNIRALPPTPIASADPAKGVCEGSNATLRIENHSGKGIYTWFKREGRNFDSIHSTPSATFQIFSAQTSDAGQYAVEITDNYGCKSVERGEVSLNVLGLPEVYFTETKACENWTEFNFVSPAGGKFTGWGCTADSSKFVPADVHQGKAVVTYTYTGPNGCVNSDKQDIEIVRLPNTPTLTANGLAADSLVKVCPGSISVTLQTSVAVIADDKYNTNYTYQWYKDGFPLPGEVALGYVATRIGSYYVRVCNQNLCWATDASAPVAISQLPPPVPPVISAQSYTFCPGEFATLFVESEDKGIFQWYKGDGKKVGEIPGEIADTYLAGEAGQYAVDYIGESGCRSALSNSLTITEHPMPKQPEIVPSQPNLYSGLSYSLQVKEPNSDEQYGWYKSTLYANVDGPTFPIKILSAIDTGSYTVRVTNQQGCYVWSDAYTLNLSKAELFIPNIFTPNGDGINDYFQIIGLDEFVENQLEILNKFGNVVFSQKNYHNSWDGEGLPNDIYYYTLELKHQDGTSSSLSGYVHLKR